ncbi:MAG: hypothetical protein Kow0065_18500 [Methylomicrobium sp.]
MMRFLIITILALQVSIPAQAQGFISQQIANQISRATSSAITQTLTGNLLIPKLKIDQASGRISTLRISADQSLLSMLHADGTIRVWDMSRGLQRPIIQPGASDFTAIEPLAGRYAVIGGQADGTLVLIDAMTGKVLQTMPTRSPIVDLVVTQDEKIALTAHADREVVAWDLESRQPMKQFNHRTSIQRLALAADDRILIVADRDNRLTKWDWATATRLSELPKPDEAIVNLWSARGQSTIALQDSDGTLQVIDLNTDRVTDDISVDDDAAAAVDLYNRRIAFTEKGRQIRMTPIGSKTSPRVITTEVAIEQLAFVNQGKTLLGADASGIAYLWDSATGRELVKLISTNSGWSTVDTEGRFDSSEAGMPNVSWVAATEQIPIDNFSSGYYEPGLLATHLQDQKFINAQVSPVPQGIYLPPKLTLSLPNDEKFGGQPYDVILDIVDEGGGVDKIRLYHNGKIVADSAMRLISETTVDDRPHRRVGFTVIPNAGSNHFKALASNAMAIDSLPVETQAEFKGPARSRRLHIVSVGINRYQDSRLNLDYSVADAQSISTILNDKNMIRFDDIATYTLYNEKATKTAFIDLLKKLAEYPQEDALAIYLAGHGIAIGPQWYFLPYETTLQNDESYYTRVGLSAAEIKSLLADIKMQRIMVLLDACYSGTGVDVFRKLQDSQRHFSRSLSKSVGIVILAATRQDQEAAEISDLGHGLFTFVVTKGLEGAADNKPKNQVVSAHEVVDFSKVEIPAFSRKYLQASQEPTAFTMGMDFELLNAF